MLALSCLWRWCRSIMSHCHIRSVEVWRSPYKKTIQLFQKMGLQNSVCWLMWLMWVAKNIFGTRGTFFPCFLHWKLSSRVRLLSGYFFFLNSNSSEYANHFRCEWFEVLLGKKVTVLLMSFCSLQLLSWLKWRR